MGIIVKTLNPGSVLSTYRQRDHNKNRQIGVTGHRKYLKHFRWIDAEVKVGKTEILEVILNYFVLLLVKLLLKQGYHFSSNLIASFSNLTIAFSSIWSGSLKIL